MAGNPLIPPPGELHPAAIVDAYLRDSGGEKQDRSVASQRVEVEAYCKHHHLVLRNIYQDTRSGKSIVGRDGFERMVADIERGDDLPDAILLWDYARFARNTKEAVKHIAAIEYKGVLVHSLTDDIPEGDYRDLIRLLKHMGNEEERKKNSRAVKRMLKQLVQLHGAMFSAPPVGFKREPLPPIPNERTGEMRKLNRWVPDPVMIPLVQRAFVMRAKGATNQQVMLATGLYPSINSYVTFFRNRLYIGELVYGDLVIPDYCEPIIERALWDEVQRIGIRRSRPASHLDHPRRLASTFLLSGLLHCQECGSPMNGYSIKQWEYYVCSRRKIKHDCNARRIPKEPIERAVIRIVEERLLALDAMLAVQTEIQNAWLTHSQESEQARREIEKKLSGAQKRIRNIAKAISEHGHSKALLNQLAALEAEEAGHRLALGQLDGFERPPAYTRPELTEIAETIKAQLRDGDENEKRVTLRGVVTRIVAARTDDHILGALYYNRVYGNVPPREFESRFKP